MFGWHTNDALTPALYPDGYRVSQEVGWHTNDVLTLALYPKGYRVSQEVGWHTNDALTLALYPNGYRVSQEVGLGNFVARFWRPETGRREPEETQKE